MVRLEIDPDSCKACEYCISQCPKNVLEFGTEVNKAGYRYVTVAREEDCIGCMICATICPDCAIEIYK